MNSSDEELDEILSEISAEEQDDVPQVIEDNDDEDHYSADDFEPEELSPRFKSSKSKPKTPLHHPRVLELSASLSPAKPHGGMYDESTGYSDVFEDDDDAASMESSKVFSKPASMIPAKSLTSNKTSKGKGTKSPAIGNYHDDDFLAQARARAQNDEDAASQFQRQRREAHVQLVQKQLRAKKQRAQERRWEYEQTLRKTQYEHQKTHDQMTQARDELTQRTVELETTRTQQHLTSETLASLQEQYLGTTRALEDSVLKLQHMSETAQAAQSEVERLKSEIQATDRQHQVERSILEKQVETQTQVMLENQASAKAALAKERAELPEYYQVLVDVEKEKNKTARTYFDIQCQEQQTLISSLRDQATQLRLETKSTLEEKEREFQRQLARERQTLQTERERLEDQRHQMFQLCAEHSSQIETSRIQFQQRQEQFEKQQLNVVREEATLESKQQIYHEQLRQLMTEKQRFESKKNQVLQMSQETYARSVEMKAQKDQLASLQSEVEHWRTRHESLQRQMQQSNQRQEQTETLKLEVEQMAKNVQLEKSVVAAQKVDTRRALEQAKKLERLVARQAAAMGMSPHVQNHQNQNHNQHEEAMMMMNPTGYPEVYY